MTTSQRRNQSMSDKYVNIVHNFKPDDFGRNGHEAIQCSGRLTGEHLWAKLID